MLKISPDSAATIPAMVGRVAFDTPPAMPGVATARGIAITSKTSIIPVTVPRRPNIGTHGDDRS